jgi:sugar/nucleoside kinase (ribokinase family)
MSENSFYDIVILGNYTKDTIVSAEGTRLVDGGGFNYGAHVASMMGLRTAAVTRLAREDVRVVEALILLGVDVFPTYTPSSTLMRLYYPTANPDERILSVSQTAGEFTPGEVRSLRARAFLINASTRGEVGIDVIRELKAKDALLSADAQGFIRVISADGTLAYEDWPEKELILSHFDILKTDAVEAERLTGRADIRTAAEMIAGWGPKEIVVTHRDGMLVLAEGRFHEAPFRPRKLVGRSGRGDTCIAAYVARRLSSSPEDACIWAAAVTSLKLEAEGPIKRPAADVLRWIQQIYGK